MKVIQNENRSLFDDFDVLMRGGVLVYSHRKCKSQVKVDLTNHNLGIRLREIIKHYDKCHRGPAR